MTTRDLSSNIDLVASLAPAAYAASANGGAVDLRGYGSAAVAFVTGTVTDGTHTPSLEHADDGITWSAVAAADLVGTLADLTSASVQRVGYRGAKRYLRAVLTVAGATTGAQATAVVVRGDPAQAPLA